MGETRALLRLMQARFGPPSADLIARVEAATPEQLDLWLARLLTAASSDEVIGATARYTIPDVYPLNSQQDGLSAMQVSKWGDSLAVRLPAAVVDALGLREGDNIEIQVEGARHWTLTRAPDNHELLARLRHLRGRLRAGFHFDRLAAHEREADLS